VGAAMRREMPAERSCRTTERKIPLFTKKITIVEKDAAAGVKTSNKLTKRGDHFCVIMNE
jgi:hypothetical protein